LPALRSLVSDFSERTSLRATFEAPPELPAFSQEADLALYRAVQEALSNVARHAKATGVRVLVTVQDEQLHLLVRDDGAGFAMGTDGRRRDANTRMGLTGMQERIHAVGGHVTFANSSSGAEVRVTLPVAELEMV
jgi:signal transduction histidine kinase